jgi:hypothetical protein
MFRFLFIFTYTILCTGLFASAQVVTDMPQSELMMIKSDELNVVEEPYLPKFAIKSNLLYMAATTLNASVEFGIGRRWTTDLAVAYNPFRLHKVGMNQLWFVQPELRYWFCQRFERHFIGLHAIYGEYNIGQVNFLTDTFKQYRYKGRGVGVGISWGYHTPISKRWAIEYSLGIGYVKLDYDKIDCYECNKVVGKRNRNYFGPTKAAVSLIFMIN